MMTKVKEDLTGRKFGHLKVIKQVEDSISPSGARRAMWLCECDCENHTKIIVSGNRLRNGKKTHCGCQSVRGMKLDLTGKCFGKLVVNKRLGKPGRRKTVMWLCDCECGGDIICSTSDLLNGKILDCGCENEKRKNEKKNNKIKKLVKEYKEKYLGKSIGHLVVKKFIEHNDKTGTDFNCWFECECDCGSKEKVKISLSQIKKVENKENKKVLSCKNCAWKYFETDKPNKYILDGDYGIGFVDGFDKDGNPDVIEFYFDLEDYDKIKRFTWIGNKLGYIFSIVKTKNILFHNLIMDTIENENIVDHGNRKPWDNRKANLRVVSTRENNQNRGLRKDNVSKVTGVSYVKKYKKWRVDVTCDGIRHYYGTFENYEDAVRQRLIGETEWFEEGFEPQRNLFEEYGVVRGISKGRKEVVAYDKKAKERGMKKQVRGKYVEEDI